MTVDDKLARSIVDFIDRDFARETEFLAELVKVPSDNPPGDCAAHAERARQLLEGLGFTVEAHPVPAAAAEAVGMTSATNLIVRHRFGDGPTIALNAHGDVVPPGLGWRVDPYGAKVEDSPHGPVMFGRGVAVSKSDFATYTWTLLALKAAAAQGARIGGTLELHFTYDEEIGGDIGPKWLIDQGLTKPDLVIAAGFSYAIVTAHDGCLHLEVTVTGKQAHAAMPDTGVDALEAATVVLTALYAYRAELAKVRSDVPGIVSPTLNVGLIKGGINTNVVPDQVDVPHRPADDSRGRCRQGRGRSAPRDRDGGASASRTPRSTCIACCWPRRSSRSPERERLCEAITRRAKEVLSVDVPLTGVPLYTDARHYAAAGIPIVLYGAGPRSILEANAHNANENLRLNDLAAATKIVALRLRRSARSANVNANA